MEIKNNKKRCSTAFIDLEADNRGKSNINVGYERNFVNIDHIVRVEKLEKKEDSRVIVHLIDGTTLHPYRTYDAIKRDINELLSE